MPTSRYRDWESFKFPPAGPDAPVAFGAGLSPASVLAGYRRGVFPLPAADDFGRTLNELRYEDEVAAGAIGLVGDDGGDPYAVSWWSPDPRPVIGVGHVHLGRNVRKRLRGSALTTTALSTTANVAFGHVARACRAGREPRWLTDPLLATLTELHRQGWAHSIEVWQGSDLVGGAMGIGIGGVISGDSLFGRQPGAAAIAVADMADRLRAAGGELIDAQWDGTLLRSLGARPVTRASYLKLLDRKTGQITLPDGRQPAMRLLPDPPA
jgi:leucyl/phenylalanyl-tRNA--protein transferase